MKIEISKEEIEKEIRRIAGDVARSGHYDFFNPRILNYNMEIHESPPEIVITFTTPLLQQLLNLDLTVWTTIYSYNKENNTLQIETSYLSTLINNIHATIKNIAQHHETLVTNLKILSKIRLEEVLKLG